MVSFSAANINGLAPTVTLASVGGREADAGYDAADSAAYVGDGVCKMLVLWTYAIPADQ